MWLTWGFELGTIARVLHPPNYPSYSEIFSFTELLLFFTYFHFIDSLVLKISTIESYYI